MRNLFKRKQTPQPIRIAKPKKQKCKIKTKKTHDGETLEFSPECTGEQIAMARQMFDERKKREE